MQLLLIILDMLLDKAYVPVEKEAMADVRKNFLDDYITEKPGKTTVVTLVKSHS